MTICFSEEGKILVHILLKIVIMPNISSSSPSVILKFSHCSQDHCHFLFCYWYFKTSQRFFTKYNVFQDNFIFYFCGSVITFISESVRPACVFGSRSGLDF